MTGNLASDPTRDAAVLSLARQAGLLADQVADLAVRARNSRRAVIVALVGLVIDLALSGGFIAAAVAQAKSSKQLQAEITQQYKVRHDVLCPLYQVFVDSYSEKARAVYPQGPDEYDATFAKIRAQYAVLNCATP